MSPALRPHKSPPVSSGHSISLPQAGCSVTGPGLYQQHRCLFYIRFFRVLIPTLAKQKSHQNPLQTSRSLQTPAINRPLIGGCNRIQFISRSDGLTFIITRGSTCHELWAIHSLVEINCITSAPYCVLRTRHTDGQQLLASTAGDQLPTAAVRDLLQGATRLIGLGRNSHI